MKSKWCRDNLLYFEQYTERFCIILIKIFKTAFFPSNSVDIVLPLTLLSL